MKSSEAAGWILTIIFSYAFLWSLLYYLKTPGTDLFIGAAVLLVLGILVKVSCPMMWRLYKFTAKGAKK